MAFDYTKMAALGVKLLTRFGKSITLVRTTGNSVDPITGVVTVGTDASVVTTGVLKPYPEQLIDGTRILSSDKELVLSNEQAVTATDKPTIDGENWSIVNIKTIKPANDVVCYFCQVRR